MDRQATIRDIEYLLAVPPREWIEKWLSAKKKLVSFGKKMPASPVERAMWPLLLTAGGKLQGKPTGPMIAVPKDVAAEALRGVHLAHRYNYGAWDFIGVARAIQLATQPKIPESEVERMRNFLTRSRRFASDKPRAGEAPSRGYLAWVVWGGDAAARWLGVAL